MLPCPGPLNTCRYSPYPDIFIPSCQLLKNLGWIHIDVSLLSFVMHHAFQKLHSMVMILSSGPSSLLPSTLKALHPFRLQQLCMNENMIQESGAVWTS
jgi:hypothetical protein